MKLKFGAGASRGPKLYCVFNKTEESFLGMKIRRADTEWSRLRGLLGKSRLDSGEGLWIVPSQGIHTVGMAFSIDVLFLDGNDRVIHAIEHFPPFRVSSVRLNCVSILELPPHTIYNSQTHVGDQLLICEPHEVNVCLQNSSPETPAPLPEEAVKE